MHRITRNWAAATWGKATTGSQQSFFLFFGGWGVGCRCPKNWDQRDSTFDQIYKYMNTDKGHFFSFIKKLGIKVCQVFLKFLLELKL